jgi:hypothetical protein
MKLIRTTAANATAAEHPDAVVEALNVTGALLFGRERLATDP